MSLMEKPPEPEPAEKRVSERLSEDQEAYGENESLLVLDILQDEAWFKFGACIEELGFGEKTDLTAPETLTREKRKQYSMSEISDQVENEKKIENRILNKIQENEFYANSDTALTLALWIDEAEDRWSKDLNELTKEEKKDLTKPESISGTRRKLTRQGFLSPDGEVQEARMEKSDRFTEYFREA